MDKDVIEQGDVFFFYRPRVDGSEVTSRDDVGRFFVLLAARQPRETYRLLMLGRKKLPRTRKGGSPSERRNWSMVSRVSRSMEPIRDELGPQDYDTKTRGHRHIDAVVPVGEGRYQLCPIGKQIHLVYRLELPETLGPAQTEFEIGSAGSFVLSLRNPAFGRPAKLPGWLEERFGSRRWLPLDDPRMLGIRGAQILWIGATPNTAGAELQVEDETLRTAEVHAWVDDLDEAHAQPLEEGVFPGRRRGQRPRRRAGEQVCPICGQRFVQPSQLKQHLKSAHPPPAPSAADVEHAIAGVDFPARRANLVRQAQANAAPPEIVRLLKRFPVRRYDTAADVAVGLGDLLA